MSAALFRKSTQKKLWSTIRGAFANGAPGWLYDDSDITTLYQDSAGTSPVTALEQPVGKQLDLSGRGNHRTQPTSANRPTWSARYNLYTKTEAINNAAWATTNCTVDPTPVAGPDGKLVAYRATFAANGHIYQNNIPAAGSIGSFTQTAYVKSATGTNQIIRQFGNGETAISSNIVVGNSWIPISFAFAFTAVTSGFITASGGTADIYICYPDLRPSDQATGLIPTYQRVDTATSYDSVGFPAGLRWNGSNSWMQNASVDFSGTNKLSVFVGVRKTNNTGAVIFELSSNSTSAGSPGSFSLQQVLAILHDTAFYVRGASSALYSYILNTEPVTEVVSAAIDVSGSAVSAKLNGAAGGWTNVGSTGGGNFGNYPAYFGARAGSNFFFNGLTFSNIAIGIELSASQIAAFEAWTNSRARAY